MNEVLNDLLVGPLGWKIACAVLALVGILVAIALIDGPWLRAKETKPRLPQQDLDGPPQQSSSRLEPKELERERRKKPNKLVE